ncbi:MAG: radical SAM protein [Betaproteobacteria bacterium]|nr:radical SAM protein [Betaproteobacteria bacterium]
MLTSTRAPTEQRAALSAGANPVNPLHLLAINLTRRCNLACAHCYLDAATLRGNRKDELSAVEVESVLEEVASRGDGTMVVLTGGEPLVRRDLEDIVSRGAGLGLAMVVGTNGTLLTGRRARSLQQAGVLGLGISVDSLDAACHDRFRGLPGAWDKTMAGIDVCRRIGLVFQIHFSVTEGNAHELPALVEFASAVGARALNVFFLVCTGRGESVTDLSPRRYEEVIKQLIELQEASPDLIVRARCAPHFKRIAWQRRPGPALNHISGREGDGCIAGIHYCRITPEGGVTACPYIEDAQGSVRETPFLRLWDEGADFRRLRAPTLRGKCGECEFHALCGGCRARARACSGDLMGADPVCAYEPRGGELIAPLAAAALPAPVWSTAAEQRLARVPAFLRALVKRRAEAYVAELGEATVTPEHLSQLTAKRFGGAAPGRPGRLQAEARADAAAGESR